MLFMALYVENFRWLQMQTFVTLNLLSLIFVVAVQPYES